MQLKFNCDVVQGQKQAKLFFFLQCFFKPRRATRLVSQMLFVGSQKSKVRMSLTEVP